MFIVFTLYDIFMAKLKRVNELKNCSFSKQTENINRLENPPKKNRTCSKSLTTRLFVLLVKGSDKIMNRLKSN